MARLPILMYHNISPEGGKSMGLTLSADKLSAQLRYIASEGYTTVFVSELADNHPLPDKCIALTFDDVTVNQMQYALPLLRSMNMKATFFVPFFYLGKTDLWNEGEEASGENIMSVEQLKSLDEATIQLAHHSFYHRRYETLTLEEIQDDFDKSQAFIAQNALKIYPALAYPYGNFPRRNPQKQAFFDLLEKNQIKMAFRIGNRLNRFPFAHRFEIQRIDIKGQDSLERFKRKLRWGKRWLF